MKNKVFIPKINSDPCFFPDPRLSLENGLLGWSSELTQDMVMRAYEKGIFPWYNENNPVLWWSPDPRMVLLPKDIKISKSLKKSMRKFTIEVDKDFGKVINLCRQTRIEKGEETWISDDIVNVYTKLFEKKITHCISVYDENSLIVGGLYGLYLGSVFCGESMFSKKADASKTALVYLCKMLEPCNTSFIDCQVANDFLFSMGAKEIERELFLQKLEISIKNKFSIF